jgi:hypothetical protein
VVGIVSTGLSDPIVSGSSPWHLLQCKSRFYQLLDQFEEPLAQPPRDPHLHRKKGVITVKMRLWILLLISPVILLIFNPNWVKEMHFDNMTFFLFCKRTCVTMERAVQGT